MSEYQIYIGDLAAYNNGILHGVWVNALDGIEVIQEEINNMLSASPAPGAEEYEVQDLSGFPSFCYSDYTSIDFLVEVAEFLDSCDFKDSLINKVVEYCGGDLENAKNMIEENYSGSFDREVDFAYDLVDQMYSESELGPMANYIDYDAFAHDLLMADYTSFYDDGKYHVFSRI